MRGSGYQKNFVYGLEQHLPEKPSTFHIPQFFFQFSFHGYRKLFRFLYTHRIELCCYSFINLYLYPYLNPYTF